MSTPSPSASSGSTSAPILTGRHLLTRRRGIVALAVVAIVAVAAALFGPALSQSSSVVPGGDQQLSTTSSNSAVDIARPLTVLTSPVSRAGPTFLTQQFTGIVNARRTTQLSAKVLGRVELIAVDFGDRVVADQSLIELDSAQLRSERSAVAASLSAAQAQLAELKHGPRRQELEQSASRVNELRSLAELQQANLNRTESLRNSLALSQQELDESRFRTQAVEAQLLAAEKSLELLQEGTRIEQLDAQRAAVEGLVARLDTIDIQLTEKRILAPYDGHVQTRLVDEGQVVAAGQPLLEIVETGVLEVHVGLPVELSHDLSSDSLQVTLGHQTIPSQLARISPTIQSTTRTREIVLELQPNSYEQLAIGSAVTVELKTPLDPQGYWIPTAALTSGARGLWAVFVATPTTNTSSRNATTHTATNHTVTHQIATHRIATHRIERRQVELLRSQGEWSEVRGPIDQSEQLVIDGIHRIVADQRVNIAGRE